MSRGCPDNRVPRQPRLVGLCSLWIVSQYLRDIMDLLVCLGYGCFWLVKQSGLIVLWIMSHALASGPRFLRLVGLRLRLWRSVVRWSLAEVSRQPGWFCWANWRLFFDKLWAKLRAHLSLRLRWGTGRSGLFLCLFCCFVLRCFLLILLLLVIVFDFFWDFSWQIQVFWLLFARLGK